MGDVTTLSPVECIECGTPTLHGPGESLYLEVGNHTVAIPELGRCDNCTALLASGRLQTNLDPEAAIRYLGGTLIPVSLIWLQSRQGMPGYETAEPVITAAIETAKNSMAVLMAYEVAEYKQARESLPDLPEGIEVVEVSGETLKALAASIGMDEGGQMVYTCPGCGKPHPLSNIPPEAQEFLLSLDTED